jgi:hypothetical protein
VSGKGENVEVASGGGGITRLLVQDEKMQVPRQSVKKKQVHCHFNDLVFRLVMVADAIAVDEQRGISSFAHNPRNQSQMDPRVTLFVVELAVGRCLFQEIEVGLSDKNTQDTVREPARVGTLFHSESFRQAKNVLTNVFRLRSRPLQEN